MKTTIVVGVALCLLQVATLCKGECVQLESLLRIEFDGHNDDHKDSKGYPCVIRMGQPPEGLNWAHFEKILCERDFDNAAFTPWRCSPRKVLPTRYSIRYWIVCRDQNGKLYQPDISKLVKEIDDDDPTDDDDLRPLLPSDNVFCSLRYKAEIDALWTASNAISIVLSMIAVFAFLVVIFVYGGPLAVGMSGTAMLSNLLLNAGAYEALNHLEYVDRGTVIYFLVGRIVVLAISVIGLVLYMENQRTPFSVSLGQLKEDLRDEMGSDDDDDPASDMETGAKPRRKDANMARPGIAPECTATLIEDQDNPPTPKDEGYVADSDGRGDEEDA